jgi:hypothetical protein
VLVKLYGAETGRQGHERKYSLSECIGARKQTITGNPDPKRPHGEVMPLRVARAHVRRQPLSRAGALFRVLQFRPHSQDHQGYAGYGGGGLGSAMVNGRYRCADRRRLKRAEEARPPQAAPVGGNFKVRHYQRVRSVECEPRARLKSSMIARFQSSSMGLLWMPRIVCRC